MKESLNVPGSPGVGFTFWWNWEKAYNGKYRSLYNAKALVASIDAFRARYGMQLDFCKEETTGRLIRDILYRELKEHLQGLEK